MSDEKETFGEEAREAAIDWWVRRWSAPLTRQEQDAFEAWLSADARHGAAFADISRTCVDLANLPASRASRRAYRTPLAVSLAACAAICALFLFSEDISVAFRASRATQIGERRLETLDDGSKVHLDAQSAIAERYDSSFRKITLLRGEAWFEVAPDERRPFVVEANGGVVTARGTSFDVALEGGGARVVVTEHRVSLASGGEVTELSAGQASEYRRGAPPAAAAAADLAASLAWRRGKLVFEDQPLGAVLEVLRRHRHGVLRCLLPATCEKRVSGVFDADDPSQTLHELQARLGLKVVKATDYLVLLLD
ncbi:MAG TPA: FecR domain-containing protein [Methylocystis sp.]|nr:FecR domain-containing protein [Methylocystis sp.]